jgi:hypothetical protein
MASIYDAIREDHARHRDLLNAIAETEGDSEKRRTLWNEFYYDVKSHAAAEEETFYSKLMATTDGQDDARHSVAEHKELDDIMEDLNETDFSSTGWLARFKTLKHDYEHHMEEEENEIFAKAQEVLDEEAVTRHGEQFLARKQQERDLVDEKAADSLEE